MQASDIDWSKAPEWATGYGFIKMTDFDVWVSDDCYTYVDGQQEGKVFSIKHGEGWSRGEIRVVSSRPAAWNGTGLPPVGALIEYRHRCLGGWRRGQVNYASCEYLILVEDGVSVEQHYFTSNMEVRPIRTPEQIAADERERAVDEMARIAGAGASAGLSAFAAIYDAGYRKVKGDKQ